MNDSLSFALGKKEVIIVINQLNGFGFSVSENGLT